MGDNILSEGIIVIHFAINVEFQRRKKLVKNYI